MPGQNDHDLGEFRSDAPRAPQLAAYMLLVIAVAKQWALRTVDVKTAFLSGELMKRVLYCWPPQDMKGVDKDRLWLLRKAVFASQKHLGCGGYASVMIFWPWDGKSCAVWQPFSP